MKIYGALAFFAFAALAFAAVWLGGLNQDEGWYLYAANMVAEGNVPYRDFFFTQGPLMPIIYSAFTGAWENFGLVGGRLATLTLGLISILFATALARLIAPAERRGAAGLIVFMLLGGNLYHVYYLTIPKTYALATMFLSMGFYLLAFAWTMRENGRKRFASWLFFASGVTMALAAGVRISLGVALAATVVSLAVMWKRGKWNFAVFAAGALTTLAVVYGPFLLDETSRNALIAAQKYHAARGGFDVVFVIGSISRLCRWYLPVFVLAGLGCAAIKHSLRGANAMLTIILASFGALFAFHLAAPFPYEDYQVPAMTLAAVWAAVAVCRYQAMRPGILLFATIGVVWACAFSNPLLEKWTVNGQDRLWTLKKEKTEIRQLRDMARVIEAIDPGGDMLLTQDLYLAIETRRHVPHGLEMGPFSMLSHDEWTALLDSAPARVAAVSGYSFAINPPVCDERPIDEQIEYWTLLKKRYDLVLKEDMFGQNATTLLLLKRKEEGGGE